MTNPSKLESAANFSSFADFSEALLILEKPNTRNAIDTNKQINISDINNGPPSINIFMNTERLIKLLIVKVSVIIILNLVKHSQTYT